MLNSVDILYIVNINDQRKFTRTSRNKYANFAFTHENDVSGLFPSFFAFLIDIRLTTKYRTVYFYLFYYILLLAFFRIILDSFMF